MTTYRTLAMAAVTAGLIAVGGAPAAAHNHVLTPSGACHESGQGTSPGNSGEGAVNPGGHEVAEAKAFAAQGGEYCQTP